MNSLDLLAAALSAASGTCVRFNSRGGSALVLHESTAIGGRVGLNGVENPTNAPRSYSNRTRQSSRNSATSTYSRSQHEQFTIFIKTQSGRIIQIEASPRNTVEEIKQAIENGEGFPVDQQRLIFAGNPLKDQADLQDYDIVHNSTIHLMLLTHGSCMVDLDIDSIAPEFDFDFSNMKDDGKKYIRGGEVYRRPYGWKRSALRVRGQYSDDEWLGKDGIRSFSCRGEWPVSYHGTSKNNAESIADEGFNLTRGTRFAFGHGVYTTPDINVAEGYATRFKHQGKTYMVVLQNRVNPATLKKVTGTDTGCGEYWISPNQVDVRPYGLLIREVRGNIC